MAPESFAGEFSSATDVYSFAITCWQIATLRVPFEGMMPLMVMKKVEVRLQVKPPLPS